MAGDDGARASGGGRAGREGARPSTAAQAVAGAVRRSPLLLAGLAVCVAASVAASLMPPLVLERATDSLVGAVAGGGGASAPGVLSEMALLATLYLGAALAEGVSGAAREAAVAVFGQRATHAVRLAMVGKLSRLPASGLEGAAAGEMVSRLTGDVGAVERLFSSGVVGMATDACTVVGIVAVVFTRSVGLGAMLCAALPALFLFTRSVQRRMLGAQMDGRAAAAESLRQVPETVSCLRAVRIYGAERHMRERYARSVEAGFSAMERSNFLDSVYSPVVISTSALIIGAMMALSAQGGAMRELFGMSVGTAVALIAYVNRVFSPLASIGMEIQGIQQAVAGVRRIDEFLARPEDPARLCALGQARQERAPGAATAPGPAGEGEAAVSGAIAQSPAAPPAGAPWRAAPSGGAAEAPERPSASERPSTPAVELDRVSFAYEEGGPLVLRDFCLRVERGETVTLVGRTGAGKSTAMGLVLGLRQPLSGTVRVFGLDPARVPDPERRRLMGHVEQRPRLVPGDVAMQVSLGDPRVSDADVLRALELAGLSEAVSRLPGGIHEPCREGTFSHGQLQLLAVARAVAGGPALLLLLDEMASGLDSQTEALVEQALRRASRGRAVLSVSHRLSGAEGGRLVELGGAGAERKG